MFTYLQACLWQIDNSFYGLLFILLGILVKNSKDAWNEMLQSETFQNPYFVAYLIWFWFAAIPWIQWFYQIPRYGIWGMMGTVNPYIIFGIRIASGVVLIAIMYFIRKKSQK